eukprot:CAMPEP_0176010546 /NCGR_PEP_ID=MMETSP0120_2-20121206/4825_1 /TAXON_ID=160619 /ORGANISM="Kryptoperidinium foliaceum, Strain CCMP 1326" /LENGTH=235 /DNA_ID=CAMNT_0017343383 /DNA_START=18 /DNA_END=722 /DNA_ORIENTATION=-
MPTTTTVAKVSSQPHKNQNKMPPLNQHSPRRVIFPAIYHGSPPAAVAENASIQEAEPELIPAIPERKATASTFDPFNDSVRIHMKSRFSASSSSRPVPLPVVVADTPAAPAPSATAMSATPPRRGNFTQRSFLGRYQQVLPSDLYPEAPKPLEKGAKLISILRESSFGSFSSSSGSPSNSPASVSPASSSKSESTQSLLETAARCSPAPSTMRRSVSEPGSRSAAKIQFDPRIWI